MTEDVQPAAIVIREDVRKKISEVNIRNRVVTQLVEEEAGARTALMSSVLIKRKELEKELKKLRPDQLSYNEDGSEKDSSYSKETAEKRKKAQEQVDRIDKALEKAIDKADYQDLKNIK